MRLSYPLSPSHKAILLAINERPNISGQEIADRSDDVCVKSVYYFLGRLEEGGWIISKTKKIPGERNRPRRLYKLTELGIEAIKFQIVLENIQ